MARNIGENIQKMRKQKQVSQEELSFALGVSRQIVSRWENGLSVPSGENLSSLAKYFGVSIEVLMGDENAATDDMPFKKKRNGIIITAVAFFGLGLVGLAVLIIIAIFEGKENGPSSTIAFTPLGIMISLAVGFVLIGLLLFVSYLLKKHRG